MKHIQKIIFLDVDGTLYDHQNGSIPQSATNIIQKARALGHLVFGCTGRHIQELQQLHIPLDMMDGWITLNGACCIYKDEVYYTHPLDTEDMDRYYALTRQYNFPTIFLSSNHMYINLDDADVRKEMEMIHTPYPEIQPLEVIEKDQILQMIPYVHQDIWHIIEDSLQHIFATRWTDLALDVVHDEVSKQVGIEKTLHYFNIPFQNTYAIGDGPNDIPMMQAVHTSIAMGNGVQSLKDICTYVTNNIDEDGLANAFEKYILYNE